MIALFIERNTLCMHPHEGMGVKSRMCPPYPKRDRKRRLNGAVCRNSPYKKGGPVSVIGRAH